MNRTSIMIGFILIFFLLGCDEHTDNTNESTIETSVINESQYIVEPITRETSPQLSAFTFGEIAVYEDILEVFEEDDFTDKNGQTIYSNEYAYSEVKRLSEDSLMCSISYSSQLGSVSDIQVEIDAHYGCGPQGSFYEADMDGDGVKDLVIIYSTSLGTDGSSAIYIYNFVTKKEVKVFKSSKFRTQCFSDIQEQVILVALWGWCAKDSDAENFNCGDTFLLHDDQFIPKPVVYNGNMGVYVQFKPQPIGAEADELIDDFFNHAILVYREGNFVVDKVWSTGKWYK